MIRRIIKGNSARCLEQETANYARKRFFARFICCIKEVSVNSRLCWHFTERQEQLMDQSKQHKSQYAKDNLKKREREKEKIENLFLIASIQSSTISSLLQKCILNKRINKRKRVRGSAWRDFSPNNEETLRPLAHTIITTTFIKGRARTLGIFRLVWNLLR